MNVRQRLRRAVSLAVGVAMATVSLVASPVDAAHADTAPVDYRALEQQVATLINQQRLQPSLITSALRSLTPNPENPYAFVTPEGHVVWGEQPYLSKSITESTQQPALPALAWSEKIATYARAWIPSVNAGARPPHGDADTRKRQLGINPDDFQSIEAIGGTDAHADSFALWHWISTTDGWKVTSDFHPDKSYLAPPTDPDWRGHRGIVNDARMRVIGVGCGPKAGASNSKRPEAVCVIDDAFSAPDASPIKTTASGQPPALTGMPSKISGSIGDTLTPGVSTVTVDASVAPTPTAAAATNAPTLAPIATQGASTASPSGASSSAAVTLCSDDDGKTCQTVTTDQPNMLVTGAFGNDSLSSVKVPAGRWLSLYRDFDYQGECQSFTGDHRTLLGTRVGQDQTSSFKISTSAPSGCSSQTGTMVCSEDNYYGACVGATGDVADLSVVGGGASALGNKRASSLRVAPGSWLTLYAGTDYQGACESFSSDHPTLNGSEVGQDSASSFKVATSTPKGCSIAAAATANPTAASPAATATTSPADAFGSCPEATTTGLSDADAAAVFHCVIDVERAKAGKSALKTNSQADALAQVDANGQSVNAQAMQAHNPCSTYTASAGAAHTDAATAQEAYKEMINGLNNAPDGSYLGTAHRNGKFAFAYAVCG